MLLGCIKKKKTKRVSALILALIIGVSSIIGAVFTVPISVFALSAGGIHTTIASIILSLLLQTGAAPVNQTWVNSLNSAYGYTVETAITNGLLTESAGTLVDTGLASSIEASAEYSSLGLGEIFSTTAADAGVMSASGGVNIANTAIHVGTAGTIGAFAGAVAVGIGAGVLINHVREYIGNFIKYGIPLTEKQFLNNRVNDGSFFYMKSLSESRTFSFNQNTLVGGKYLDTSTNNYKYSIVTTERNNYYWNIKYYNSKLQETYSYNVAERVMQPNSPISNQLDRKANEPGSDNYHTFSSQSEMLTYFNEVSQGLRNPYPIISPDIVGPEGNQAYDNENDTFPGLINQIPEGQDMTPVNMDDYQDYIDTANNNTNNGDTGQTIQGEAFDDLIDSLIVAAPTIPDEPIIPDQPVDVPVVPERPVTPDQPTMPDKPSLTDQEVQDALNGVTTIDLRSIFPFCIPFDLYNILLIFDTGENRRAPHITFTFPFTDWVIDVDLAVFDPVAGILRVLELILFIIGLAVATRKLIGAGGG